jgi:hypothetical protein
MAFAMSRRNCPLICDFPDIGVGHFARADTASISVPPSRALLGDTSPPWSPSVAVGVGHKPEPVPLVRGANVGSSQHSPPRVIPEFGKVAEDSSKPSMNERWGVLHEDESGSYFANHPRHLSPEAGSFFVQAGALSGDADVLAGKPARNHVNTAAPRESVKGANVIPNREGREKSVVLSLGKNACGVGFPLDSADRAPSEEVSSKNAATSACEKSQLIH